MYNIILSNNHYNNILQVVNEFEQQILTFYKFFLRFQTMYFIPLQYSGTGRGRLAQWKTVRFVISYRQGDRRSNLAEEFSFQS